MKIRYMLLLWMLAAAFLPGAIGLSGGRLEKAAIEVKGELSTRAPRVVFLIRHGEKPPKEEHSSHLTDIGKERARRLPSLFVSPAKLLRPDALFATHASHNSNREVETLMPLAQNLKLPIHDQYGEDDGAKMAAEILSGQYAGKVVLVCWHDGKLPKVAEALGIKNPPKWPDSTFDRIWKIEWPGGKAVMTDIPEGLMPGDSK